MSASCLIVTTDSGITLYQKAINLPATSFASSGLL